MARSLLRMPLAAGLSVFLAAGTLLTAPMHADAQQCTVADDCGGTTRGVYALGDRSDAGGCTCWCKQGFTGADCGTCDPRYNMHGANCDQCDEDNGKYAENAVLGFRTHDNAMGCDPTDTETTVHDTLAAAMTECEFKQRTAANCEGIMPSVDANGQLDGKWVACHLAPVGPDPTSFPFPFYQLVWDQSACTATQCVDAAIECGDAERFQVAGDKAGDGCKCTCKPGFTGPNCDVCDTGYLDDVIYYEDSAYTCNANKDEFAADQLKAAKNACTKDSECTAVFVLPSGKLTICTDGLMSPSKGFALQNANPNAYYRDTGLNAPCGACEVKYERKVSVMDLQAGHTQQYCTSPLDGEFATVEEAKTACYAEDGSCSGLYVDASTGKYKMCNTFDTELTSSAEVWMEQMVDRCDPEACDIQTDCSGQNVASVSGNRVVGCTCKCKLGFKGSDCSECARGYSGDSCATCTASFESKVFPGEYIYEEKWDCEDGPTGGPEDTHTTPGPAFDACEQNTACTGVFTDEGRDGYYICESAFAADPADGDFVKMTKAVGCAPKPCLVESHCNGQGKSVTGDLDAGCKCECETGYAGDDCGQCAEKYERKDGACVPKPCTVEAHCSGKADSVTGDVVQDNCVCKCQERYAGATCNACKAGFEKYPDCTPEATPEATQESSSSAASSSSSTGSSSSAVSDMQQSTPTSTPSNKPTLPTSTPTTPAQVSARPCPNSQVDFSLWEGVRHRIDSLRFDGDSTQTRCSFRFTCPATSSGMAIRITKSVPQGSDLSVSADVPTSTGAAVSLVSATTGLSAVFSRREVQVTAFGNGGSIAVVASCITGAVKIPQNADDVNYIGTDSLASRRQQQEMKVDVTAANFKTYTVAGSARQEKALLLSCASADLTNGNPVVQIVSIAGALNAATNDALVVTALDSQLSETFVNAVDRTFARTTDVGTFAASSQYYVTWSSDSSAAVAGGVTISYQCANTAWTQSGAGVEQQPSSGAAATAGWALSSLAAAMVIAAM